MKQRIFNSFKDLEQLTHEMAGVNEFQSNATGKDEVDVLYNAYLKLYQELEALNINIENKIKYIYEQKIKLTNNPAKIITDNPEYKIISDSLTLHIKAREGHAEGSLAWIRETPIINDLTQQLNNIPKEIEMDNKIYFEIKANINKAESELSLLKSKKNLLNTQVNNKKAEYIVAKNAYEKNKAEQEKIDLEAYEKQKLLEAEAVASNIEKQKDFELEQERSTALKAEKKEKTKKLIIGSVVGLLLIGGIVIGIKKGWFKK
jgi:hypothetical protein